MSRDSDNSPDVRPSSGATVQLPGLVNAHSHAFHRMLRGRTHVPDPGHPNDSFWTWRDRMYALARLLGPDSYRQLATAVYAEMVTAGYTAVGEFHYVHRPAAAPISEPHAMELAVVRAALDVGIRLTLLDTCYLRGGLDPQGRDVALDGVQERFSDGTAGRWAERHAALRAAVAALDAGRDLVSVGTAVHSVRAVREEDLPIIAAALGPDEVLHAHISEQPAENTACLAATGLTPTALLHRHGLVTKHFTAVHATHLTDADITVLGDAHAGVAFCPTTEADLGDGIGPAHRLVDAGAVLCIGSDQHAVIDPLLELRALEHGERLASLRRARFTPDQLVAAGSTGGIRSLGLGGEAAADCVVVDLGSTRTRGARPEQVVLCATAADVIQVDIAARTVARNGIHVNLGNPADLYATFFDDWPAFA